MSLFGHGEELGPSSCCQLADTEALPGLKELLGAAPSAEERTWDLLSWILSPKTFTIQSIKKQEVRPEVKQPTGVCLLRQLCLTVQHHFPVGREGFFFY